MPMYKVCTAMSAGYSAIIEADDKEAACAIAQGGGFMNTKWTMTPYISAENINQYTVPTLEDHGWTVTTCWELKNEDSI